MTLVWWVGSGGWVRGPDGNAQRYAIPDDQVSPGPSTATPQPVPGGLRIDSFARAGATTLELTYDAPPPGCGRLATPRVLETDAAVTVTLSLDAPEPTSAGSCDTRTPASVVVGLSSPLDGRSVLDGSVVPQVRVEEAAR